MTSPADPAICALRAVHDELADRAGGFSDADIDGPSGAAEWTMAQLLSHIGSGAEIGLANLEASLSQLPAPEGSFNQSVWDRWNAMSPREQADSAIATDERLVAAYESIDDDVRNSLRIQLGFLPEPIGLDLAVAFRLNESTLHGWDAAVVDNAAATLNPAAVPVLLDALAGPLSFLIGWIGKSTVTDQVIAVRTTHPERELALTVGSSVALAPNLPSTPDGTLSIPAEALLRLFAGRLGSDSAPDRILLTGGVEMPALRAVFPGF